MPKNIFDDKIDDNKYNKLYLYKLYYTKYILLNEYH